MTDEFLADIVDLDVEFRTGREPISAVDGFSLRIRQGEIVGIVGETGSGKSTVARALIGLLPDNATVRGTRLSLSGVDVMQASEASLRRIRGVHVGFIPQNPFGALNPTLKIRRQFRNVIKAHTRRPKDEVDQSARSLLEKVGIREPERVLDGYAHELSGGMAQRVVIAMALSLGPELVIADEPTTGLDVTIQRQILDLLASVTRQENRSALLVTHDVGVVAQNCDRVVVMYAGQVLEVGPVASVLVNPRHPYTRGLLGSVPRRGHPLVRLKGSMPTHRERAPDRCIFFDRCTWEKDERCSVERPQLQEVGEDHQVASFCELPSWDRP